MNHKEFIFVKLKTFAVCLFAMLFCCGSLWAQVPPGSLHGQVTDPTGAVIPGATVTVQSAGGQRKTATTDGQGLYDVKGLPPDAYTVSAVAKGFSPSEPQVVAVTSGQAQKANISLEILVEKQQVEVQSETNQVEVSPENNASSLVIKGKDLEALSDDPDELQSELTALAGPAAGPNGGQIYIDGFTGGQLPPKSAIREIRVNQNPFSAEYDKLGYGRIEVFTKPGTDKLHGQVMYDANNAVLNSMNPFAGEEPGYQTSFINGRIGGPINKKASYAFDGDFRDINDFSVISTSVTDFLPPGEPSTMPNPRKRFNLTPRVDYQLTPTNTLTIRYQYVQRTEDNDGVGGTGPVALTSQAYNYTTRENTIQAVDTQQFGPKVVNETRFEYERDTSSSIALNGSPALNVLGIFLGGGNTIGTNHDTQNHFEAQNYTSIAQGNHFIKFGGRIRYTGDANYSTPNFNGTYTFANVNAYYAGTPSQFSLTAGTPQVSASYVDGELYAEDDWRIRPNMTLSYGLRYELQNYIDDYKDFAPRVGFSWGLSRGKSAPKTVLRAGYGVFYDRFTQDLIMNVTRLNGINQQQAIVQNPTFYPNAPPFEDLIGIGSTTRPTKYEVSPNLRAPYTMQIGIGIERQVTKSATVSVTYLNSRGVHQFYSDNVNAPIPGTYNPADPAAAEYPYGFAAGNIYQYQSEGYFKQQQLIANFNIRAGKRLSLFGFYTLNYANSNTDGANSFPIDQYNLETNWGRALFDTRDRFVMGGTLAMRYGIRLSPFIFAGSGSPFNITYGDDLNGDSIFNDRPVYATASGPGVVSTPWGLIDSTPGASGALIPRNLGTGPSAFTFNLRVSKTIGFGKVGEGAGGQGGPHGGPHGGGIGGRGLGGGGGNPFAALGPATTKRYNLTFTAAARNLFNNVNLSTPVGNINSQYFNQSLGLAGGPFNTAAANRRIDLQVVFAF